MRTQSPAADPAVVAASSPGPTTWPLYVAAFVATFTFSIGNVAAPGVARSFHASAGDVTLMLGGFTAAYAAGLILAGRLGDRYGRRRLLVLGLVVSALAGVAATLAPTMAVLVLARIAAGIGCALFTPQILATIQTTSTGAGRAGRVNRFIAANGSGTASGQVIGGLLISLSPTGWGWRAAMASIVVVSLIALAGVGRVVPTRSAEDGGLDFIGSVILGGSLLALEAVLSLAPGRGWPLWTLLVLGAALVGLIAFRLFEGGRERQGRSVLVPPSVVGLRPVVWSLLMTLVFAFGFGGFMYAYNVFAQAGLHLSALLSGVVLLPFALTFIAAATGMGAIQRRLGDRTMVAGGVVQILGLAAVIATLPLSRTHPGLWVWVVQAPFVVLGVAQASQFGPLVATVMAEVPTRVAGLTGGLVTTVQQAALGLGAAVLGGVLAAAAARADWQRGFGTVLAVQAAGAVVFVVLAQRLRRQRRA